MKSQKDKERQIEDIKKYLKVMKFEKGKKYALVFSKDSGIRQSDAQNINEILDKSVTCCILVEGDVEKVIKQIKI